MHTYINTQINNIQDKNIEVNSKSNIISLKNLAIKITIKLTTKICQKYKREKIQETKYVQYFRKNSGTSERKSMY